MASSGNTAYRYRVHILLLIILLIALLARLYALGKESIWLDEATSLMLARMDLAELVRWTARDIHPPLYYILLHFWIVLGDSEAILRGLSVLAGVLNVLAIYALGRELFDAPTGLLSACFLALDPFHIWYSQETRMYAWTALLFSAIVWAALLYLHRPRQLALGLYVALAVAGLYTHYYTLFALLLTNLWALYALMRKHIPWRSWWYWVGAQLVVLLLFLLWLPNLLAIMGGGGGWLAFTERGPSLAVLAQTAIFYMVGMARTEYPLLARRLGYVTFALASGCAMWSGIAKQQPMGNRRRSMTAFTAREAVWLTASYLVLPLGIAWVASQVFKPMYSARYMLPFLMPFLLLVAWGIRQLSGKLLPLAMTCLLVLIMGTGIFLQARTLEKPDWRGWAARIQEESQEGDLVFFMPGWHAAPFDYYAQGTLPIYSDMPLLMERYDEQALAQVDAAIARHPRIWFVWEKGHYTDPKGAVYQRLAERCIQVATMPMLRLGQVVLFENPEAASP